MANTGYSFTPESERRLRTGINGAGGQLGPQASQALKVLSLRLPNVLGGNPISPDALLRAQGGGVAGITQDLGMPPSSAPPPTPTPPAMPTAGLGGDTASNTAQFGAPTAVGRALGAPAPLATLATNAIGAAPPTPRIRPNDDSLGAVPPVSSPAVTTPTGGADTSMNSLVDFIMGGDFRRGGRQLG
jgi:hypothetical protein